MYQLSLPFNFRNPSEHQIFEYIDKLIDIDQLSSRSIPSNSRLSPNPKMINTAPYGVSDMIIACHNNKSIYDVIIVVIGAQWCGTNQYFIFKVLRMENHINLSSILNVNENYNINKELDSLIASIKVPKVDILNNATKEQINTLSKSELGSFSSDHFVDNVS